MAARSARTPAVDIGLEPLVDLLPSEIRRERAQGRVVRRAWFGVGGVALVAALAVGAASYHTTSTTMELAQAQARTATLLSEQAKYAPVVKADKEADLVRAAQQVGASTEIDWASYLDQVQSKLESGAPSNARITGSTIESASPMTAYQQASGPLQGARIATLTFTVESDDLPAIPDWLTGLSSLPGYVDAAPQSITKADGGGDSAATYTTQLTLHIDAKAYANRFAESGKKG